MSFETWNKFVNNLNNCIFNLFNFEIFFYIWTHVQEWTIQIHWQCLVHKTQDEDKQKQKHAQHRKLRHIINTDPSKTWGELRYSRMVKQFLHLIRLFNLFNFEIFFYIWTLLSKLSSSNQETQQSDFPRHCNIRTTW
jgi:hypothetical protein